MVSVYTVMHANMLFFYEVSSTFLTQFGYDIFSRWVYCRPLYGVRGCTAFNMLSISTEQTLSFCGQRKDSDAYLGCEADVTVTTFFHHNIDPSLSTTSAGNTAVHTMYAT
jgi:hypothetical protein